MASKQWLTGTAGAFALAAMTGAAQSASLGSVVTDFKPDATSNVEQAQYQTLLDGTGCPPLPQRPALRSQQASARGLPACTAISRLSPACTAMRRQLLSCRLSGTLPCTAISRWVPAWRAIRASHGSMAMSSPISIPSAQVHGGKACARPVVTVPAADGDVIALRCSPDVNGRRPWSPAARHVLDRSEFRLVLPDRIELSTSPLPRE